MAWLFISKHIFFVFLQSFGFNLMATSNYHWLLSFSRAEQVLLAGIDEDGGCRRKCYRVVRQLKEDVWCPGSKPVITTHHLQVLSVLLLSSAQPCATYLINLHSSCVLKMYCNHETHAQTVPM